MQKNSLNNYFNNLVDLFNKDFFNTLKNEVKEDIYKTITKKTNSLLEISNKINKSNDLKNFDNLSVEKMFDLYNLINKQTNILRKLFKYYKALEKYDEYNTKLGSTFVSNTKKALTKLTAEFSDFEDKQLQLDRILFHSMKQKAGNDINKLLQHIYESDNLKYNVELICYLYDGNSNDNESKEIIFEKIKLKLLTHKVKFPLNINTYPLENYNNVATNIKTLKQISEMTGINNIKFDKTTKKSNLDEICKGQKFGFIVMDKIYNINKSINFQIDRIINEKNNPTKGIDADMIDKFTTIFINPLGIHGEIHHELNNPREIGAKQTEEQDNSNPLLIFNETAEYYHVISYIDYSENFRYENKLNVNSYELINIKTKVESVVNFNRNQKFVQAINLKELPNPDKFENEYSEFLLKHDTYQIDTVKLKLLRKVMEIEVLRNESMKKITNQEKLEELFKSHEISEGFNNGMQLIFESIKELLNSKNSEENVEMMTSFMTEVVTYNKKFMTNLINIFNDNKMSANSFKNLISNSYQLYEYINKIVKKALDDTITRKSNVYDKLLYKLFLLHQ
jgi:hypothetical protein